MEDEIYHMRCAAHTLKLVVKDGLKGKLCSIILAVLVLPSS